LLAAAAAGVASKGELASLLTLLAVLQAAAAVEVVSARGLASLLIHLAALLAAVAAAGARRGRGWVKPETLRSRGGPRRCDQLGGR